MKHVVQSPEWGQFKTKMGTQAVVVPSKGDASKCIQFTKHRIPIIEKYLAYCPKVNPNDIDFETLKDVLKNENCIAINFDVPNIEITEENSTELGTVKKLFENNCVKSPKDTFAKSNVVLDISATEETILERMHKKHRYNIRYAEKQGVKVREGITEKDFDIFYKLLKETADRQKYFIHPRSYYKNLWEMLGTTKDGKDKIAYLLIAEFENKPLTAWMLFNYEGVLYYPYGGSSEENKNLQHSLAVAWEAIKLGKKLNCKIFDMWGAADNPNDINDPWHGFTEFKMKFGGRYVKYMDSYDYVIDKPIYTAFNIANKVRWLILKLLK